MNELTITGTLVSADVGCREFFLQLPGTKLPLVCQLQEGQWQGQFPLGSKICVKGRFASRDLCKQNPCDCHTTTNIIESYVKVTDIAMAKKSCNEVAVSGRLTGEPRLIKTPSASFYSARIHLDDGAGYAAVTTEQMPGTRGNAVTVSGRLRAKDYSRHMECPCCKGSWKLPILSVGIRGGKIPAKI